jgi:hypothetical protein
MSVLVRASPYNNRIDPSTSGRRGACGHLHDFKNRFGHYPDSLVHLSKLDSTDYSYTVTSWKLGYLSKGHGKSFELNGYPESAIDSLVMGYELNRQNAIQTMNRFEECMVTR